VGEILGGSVIAPEVKSLADELLGLQGITDKNLPPDKARGGE